MDQHNTIIAVRHAGRTGIYPACSWYQVVCTKCGKSGPWRKDKQAAKNAWDKGEENECKQNSAGMDGCGLDKRKL